MSTHHQQLTQARAFRADIVAAPAIWLPRRDNLLVWLNEFLARAETPKYEINASEAEDLVALGQFLRKKRVPVAT